MFSLRSLHKPLLLALAFAALGGCRGCDEEPAAEPPAPRAVEPEGDRTPPVFAGIRELALVGEQTWRARWEAAEDETSPADALVYEVHHGAGGRTPVAESEPLLRTQPGALSATFSWDGEPGSFFVRAVDEAGNASAFSEGLSTASQMPWERLPDGGDAAPLERCVRDAARWPEGRTVCLSAQGRPRLWTGEAWDRIPGLQGEAFLAGTAAAGLMLADSRGRMWQVEPDGEATRLEVRWEDGLPRMPLRGLLHDPYRLDYVIDSRGRVWVGELPRMLAMQRPLALPQAGRCTELHTKFFAGPDGYALCRDDRVYVARTDAPMLRWSPLVADVAPGLFGDIVAHAPEGRERVLLIAGEQAWRLSGEGWDALEAPGDAAVRDVIPHDGGHAFASAVGVLQLRGNRLHTIRGSEGDLAAAVPAEGGALHLIHRDGAVARFDRGRTTWIVAPPIGEILAVGGDSLGNRIIHARRPAPALHRWRNGQWQEIMRTPALEALRVHGVAADGERAWIAGDGDGVGVLLRGQAGRWNPEPLFVDRMLLEEMVRRAEVELPGPLSRMQPDPEEPPWTPDLPLPPLDGPSLAQLGGLFGVEPLRGIEVSADGRGVAWSDHQVWLRGARGWYLVHRSDERLSGALLDTGQAWIALGESRIRRCVRSLCGEGVPQLETTPDSRPRLVRMGGMGAREVVTASGATWRFDAAFASPEELADVPLRWPSGEFVQELPPREGRDLLQDRLVHEGADVIVNEAGELLLSIDGRRVSQGSLSHLIALWPLDEGWGALTRDGLLRPVPPAPATR